MVARSGRRREKISAGSGLEAAGMEGNMKGASSINHAKKMKGSVQNICLSPWDDSDSVIRKQLWFYTMVTTKGIFLGSVLYPGTPCMPYMPTLTPKTTPM